MFTSNRRRIITKIEEKLRKNLLKRKNLLGLNTIWPFFCHVYKIREGGNEIYRITNQELGG